jgi:hypothetical protein
VALPVIQLLAAHGVGQAIATGYTLVLHVALWLPITLLGALFMIADHLGWSDMERAAQL